MSTVWRLARRVGRLALAIAGLQVWLLGCSDSTTTFASGIRVDQLLHRDLDVTVTETTAVISWITRDEGQSRVSYGLTTALGQVATGNAHPRQHRVELGGLTPDTVYFYQLDGRRVTYRFRTLGGPRGRLAFVSDRADGRREVYLSLDWGENVQRVTTGGGDTPALSRDGTRLAWSATGAGGSRDIFLATLDAAGVVPGSTINLTNTPDREETQPDFSPDGGQVVLVTSQAGAGSQLVVRAVDTAAERVLVNNGATVQEPAWRPNGEQIAFASNTRTAVIQLGVRPVDPGSLSVVLNEPARTTVPPNEYRLLDAADGLVDFSGSSAVDRSILVRYTSGGLAVGPESHRVPRTHLEIFTVKAADGTELRRLTNSGDRDARSAPTWHPTQALLVLVGESGSATNLFGLADTGGNLQSLTRGDYRDRTPRVSPDGTWLVFSADRHEDRLINLYRADFAGNIWELNLFSSGDTQPSWSVVP